VCHFISGLIEKDFAINELNTIGKLYGINFSVCENSFVQSQLKPSEIYLIKTNKHCDCGTELGFLNRLKKKEDSGENKLSQLRKKGWSEAKIERWLNDKSNKQPFDPLGKKYPDLENWNSFIQTLFAQTKIKKFGLLLHWYRGDVFSERIKIKERIELIVDQLDISELLKIQEDGFYLIKRF